MSNPGPRAAGDDDDVNSVSGLVHVVPGMDRTGLWTLLPVWKITHIPQETTMPETTAAGPNRAKHKDVTTSPDALTADERRMVERVRAAPLRERPDGKGNYVLVQFSQSDRDALIGLVARLEKRLAEVGADAQGMAATQCEDPQAGAHPNGSMVCGKVRQLESQLAARAAGPVPIPDEVRKAAERIMAHVWSMNDFPSPEQIERAKVLARWIRSLSPPEAGRG